MWPDACTLAFILCILRFARVHDMLIMRLRYDKFKIPFTYKGESFEVKCIHETTAHVGMNTIFIYYIV